MTSVVPGLGPLVTTPEDKPIEATPGLLLVQVPPVIPSVNVVVFAPAQMLEDPPITVGCGFTVSVAVTEHPAGVE